MSINHPVAHDGAPIVPDVRHNLPDHMPIDWRPVIDAHEDGTIRVDGSAAMELSDPRLRVSSRRLRLAVENKQLIQRVGHFGRVAINEPVLIRAHMWTPFAAAISMPTRVEDLARAATTTVAVSKPTFRHRWPDTFLSESVNRRRCAVMRSLAAGFSASGDLPMTKTNQPSDAASEPRPGSRKRPIRALLLGLLLLGTQSLIGGPIEELSIRGLLAEADDRPTTVVVIPAPWQLPGQLLALLAIAIPPGARSAAEKPLTPPAAASPHHAAPASLAESTDSPAFVRTTLHDDAIHARRKALFGRASRSLRHGRRECGVRDFRSAMPPGNAGESVDSSRLLGGIAGRKARARRRASPVAQTPSLDNIAPPTRAAQPR